ncbi:MAG: cell envelope integrity protein TolA [Caldimonas sp.]
MSAAALQHDAFAPQRPPGMRSGLVLALAIHALLVVALAWSVNWHTSEPEGVVAELWSALPQMAAPRAATPEPPRVVEPAPPQPAPPKPEPAPERQPDPQIAIERAAKEKARREETERVEAARRAEIDKREQARREEAQRADAARKDEARLAALREANLKRMMGQAGASDEASTGNAARTAGPSAGYAGRIKARIKPNIVLTTSVAGNPLATVEVRLAPDGTIVGRKLVKSSGSPVWDETVLRAIDKTEVLPRDTDGRVPPLMQIEFKPFE